MNDKNALPILKPTDVIGGKRIDQLPVYYIPDRTDGKPSINTPEGWERFRVKSLIQMRLLEMMKKQGGSTKKDVSSNCTISD